MKRKQTKRECRAFNVRSKHATAPSKCNHSSEKTVAELLAELDELEQSFKESSVGLERASLC
jgi:hypothetical protein